jgi:hypothetical protein
VRYVLVDANLCMFSLLVYISICLWGSIYQEGDGWNLINRVNSTIRLYICLKPGQGAPTLYVY